MDSPQYNCYPNRFANRYLQCAEEVTGKIGVHTLLHFAELSHFVENPPPDNLANEFDLADFSRLHFAFEEMGGQRLGRGIAWRTGMCFLHNHIFDLPDVPFTPENQGKIALSDAFPVIVQIIGMHLPQIPKIEETETHYTFALDICPACHGRDTLCPRDWKQSPPCEGVCGMIVGGLWRLTGARYEVNETACKARNEPACTFEIYKFVSEKG